MREHSVTQTPVPQRKRRTKKLYWGLP